MTPNEAIKTAIEVLDQQALDHRPSYGERCAQAAEGLRGLFGVLDTPTAIEAYGLGYTAGAKATREADIAALRREGDAYHIDYGDDAADVLRAEPLPEPQPEEAEGC